MDTMNLRDYLAASATQTLVGKYHIDDLNDARRSKIAKTAYDMADSVLEEGKQKEMMVTNALSDVPLPTK